MAAGIIFVVQHQAKMTQGIWLNLQVDTHEVYQMQYYKSTTETLCVK